MADSDQMALFGSQATARDHREEQRLVTTLQRYNAAYRAGKPLVSDAEYDALTEALRRLNPSHEFLLQVEPEELGARSEVRHPSPMLSTQKAYTQKELEAWVARMEKARVELGLEEALVYRVTPKLDGLAGRDEQGIFATRGNGRVGANISFAWERGIVPVGGRGLGVGEIVIQKSYFEAHLSERFEHPRNLCVGIVSADVVNEDAKIALEAGAVHFVPYVGLVSWTGDGATLVEQSESISAELKGRVDYALDGMVAEVVNQAVRDHLGATNHHNRWQIALKERGESAEAQVREVLWQTGRTGNVTPVLVIEPVKLSGATISRITAHHAGLVRERCLGPGAQIEIIRSGEVIPKLVGVLQESKDVKLPEACPRCGTKLSWREDFLRCPNRQTCPGQVVHRLRHFFWIMGNSDGMGIKTIERLVEGGHTTLRAVFALEAEDFLGMDFGPGQTKVLVRALEESRTKTVEDARFLAALGVSDLGIGESRKLLAHHRLESLGEIQVGELEAIKGFGPVTSERIVNGLQGTWEEVVHLLSLGFQFERTPLLSDQVEIESPIAGQRIVFTGSMQQGSREEMKLQARLLGANVQSAVNGKTDLLVVGEKAGSKLQKAQNLGVRVLTEVEYLELIAG